MSEFEKSYLPIFVRYGLIETKDDTWYSGFDCEKFLADILQKEVEAHEVTKRNHKSVIERLFYSEREQLRLDKELEETKKRLEDLEDALNYSVTTKKVEIGDKVFQAVQNSRARGKS